jgi:hypothetical protein
MVALSQGVADIARDEIVRGTIRDARRTADAFERFSCGLSITIGFEGGREDDEGRIAFRVEDELLDAIYSVAVPIGSSRSTMARVLVGRVDTARARLEVFYRCLPDWFLTR